MTKRRIPRGRFYLAYGSNLNLAQMRLRCPKAVPDGSIMLRDARLVFRGVADVIYSPGDEVPVGVWRITPDCERALDRYEAVDNGLYSKEEVALSDGREALIYVMNDDGIAPPSRWYLDTIREGYDDFRLDHRFLDEAVRHSWTRKDHSHQTFARRERQRRDPRQRLLAEMPVDIALRKIERRRAR